MTRKIITLVIFSAFYLGSCSSQTYQNKPVNDLIDTTKSFRIDNYRMTPKLTFDFNSVLKSSGDTIDIVTCGEYVYFPFGHLKDKKDLKESLLKNFNIIDRVDKMDDGNVEFQILKLGSSRLILYFDKDSEASVHSYIFKGEIKDSSVELLNHIKIGMSTNNFYKTFFDYFSPEIENRYKVIVFESCVEGIKHIYNFDNNKLTSIKFNTDSYWKVSY